MSALLARRTSLAVLAALGLASVVGTAMEGAPSSLGLGAAGQAIAGFGKLSLASPLPKVFCKVGAEEPFAYEHVVTLEHEDGRKVDIPIDRARYARFAAPYQYRNVYGAVFAFAPRLRSETNAAVIRHGFCDGGPLAVLASERGSTSANARVVTVTVASWPRRSALGAPRTMRVVCPER